METMCSNGIEFAVRPWRVAASVWSNQRSVSPEASRHRLPALQAALLSYLREHHGRTVPREELAAQVWQQRYFAASRAIDQAVAGVRKWLVGGPERIVTVWGEGYRYEVEAR